MFIQRVYDNMKIEKQNKLIEEQKKSTLEEVDHI